MASRGASAYGLEETFDEVCLTATPGQMRRKPLHAGVRLEAMDHEVSKRKINNLMSQQTDLVAIQSSPG